MERTRDDDVTPDLLDLPQELRHLRLAAGGEGGRILVPAEAQEMHVDQPDDPPPEWFVPPDTDG